MKKKLVIFGTGSIAELAKFYFENDSEYNIIGFTVNSIFIKGNDTFLGKPLVPFENIEDYFSPQKVSLFVALSYTKMNDIRKKIYFEAKQKGYSLATYISSKCTYLSEDLPGDNCFILENNTIQPFVKIGNNVFLWSGNHIGHHSKILDNNFISSHVVISGHCTINENCFLGVNSTIAHKVDIAQYTLVGAGSIINRNTSSGSVWVPTKATCLNKLSFDISL